MGTALKSMNVSIDTAVLDKVTDYCNKHGYSRNLFISKALDSYLQECKEDSEDYNAALSAWNEFEAGDQKTYTTEELRKELSL